MLSWISGRLRCFRGKHERSQKHLRKGEGAEEYTSICTYCRAPLKRRSKRDWIVSRR